MTTLQTSNKQSFYLVRFQFGPGLRFAGQTIFSTYYTNNSENIEFKGKVHVSNTSLEVDPPSNSALIDEDPLIIKIKRDGSFLIRASDRLPHAPIQVTVWETFIDLENGNPVEQYYVYTGKLSSIRRNPDDKIGLLELTIKNFKHYLESEFLLTANHQCPWRLGDANCGVIIPDNNWTVASIVGAKLTISETPGQADGYFHRGYIIKDDLAITIFEWDNDKVFTLMRQPPAYWDSSTITVRGGCDKHIATCRTIWSNEDFFAGTGFAIPDYNPLFEIP